MPASAVSTSIERVGIGVPSELVLEEVPDFLAQFSIWLADAASIAHVQAQLLMAGKNIRREAETKEKADVAHRALAREEAETRST